MKLYELKSALGFAYNIMDSWRTGNAMKKFSLTLELTYRCNLRCTFCERWAAKWPEPSFEDIDRVLVQAREMDCLFVAFTGGEPLIHKDFDRMMERCNQLRQYFSINTNGILLWKKADAILRNSKHLLSVNVSLHSHLPEIHDRLSGIKGAFENTIKGIQAIKDKVDVIICVTVTPDNFPQLAEISDLANQLGVRIRFQPVHMDPTAMLTLKETPDFSHLDYERQYKEIMRLIEKSNISKRQRIYLKLFPLFFLHPEFFKGRACVAAGRSLYIMDPKGDIFPCDTRRDVLLGNVFKDGLKSVITGDAAQKWRERCKKLKHGCHCMYACVAPTNILFGKLPLIPILPSGWPVSSRWEKEIQECIHGKQ